MRVTTAGRLLPDSSRLVRPHGRHIRSRTAVICALILTASACGGGTRETSSSDAASTGTTANDGADFTADQELAHRSPAIPYPLHADRVVLDQPG